MLLAHSREPAAVGQSKTSKMSLMPSGMPCSGPRYWPRRSSSVSRFGLGPGAVAVDEAPRRGHAASQRSMRCQALFEQIDGRESAARGSSAAAAWMVVMHGQWSVVRGSGQCRVVSGTSVA